MKTFYDDVTLNGAFLVEIKEITRPQIYLMNLCTEVKIFLTSFDGQSEAVRELFFLLCKYNYFNFLEISEIYVRIQTSTDQDLSVTFHIVALQHTTYCRFAKYRN